MATMPFTDVDLKPVVTVAQKLLSLLQDPDVAGHPVRYEIHHLQNIVIEYGPEAYHIEEQDGSPYAQDGTSRCTRDAPYYAKRIDVPELARIDVVATIEDRPVVFDEPHWWHEISHVAPNGRRRRTDSPTP
jgi:hypothetical protein